jgi:hypothetical protein
MSDTEKVWLEPYDDGLAPVVGPFDDEIDASFAMDRDGLSDLIYKMVWRTDRDAEVIAELRADGFRSQPDKPKITVLEGDDGHIQFRVDGTTATLWVDLGDGEGQSYVVTLTRLRFGGGLGVDVHPVEYEEHDDGSESLYGKALLHTDIRRPDPKV